MHTHLSRVLLATSLAAFLALGAPAFAQSHADDPTSTQTAAKPATKTAAETATESAGDTTADPAAERPLIERSLLLVPAQAGDFELRRLADYPGQPAMGAGVRYVHPDFPELALDVFIYPLGDFTRTEALDWLENAMREELRNVEASGRYERVDFGDVIDIDLQRIDDDGTLLAPRADLVAATGKFTVDTEDAKRDTERRIVAAMEGAQRAAEAVSDPDIGRRMAIRLREGGVEKQSASFLFYRSLYAIQARSTAPVAMGPDTFDRLANHAIASILPAVEIRNAGGCADSEVVMDPDLDVEAGAIVLAAKMSYVQVRMRRNACSKALDETVPEGREGVVLDVASLWSGDGAP